MRRLALVLIAGALTAFPAPAIGAAGDGKETQPVTYNIEGIYRSGQRIRITGGNKHAIAEANLRGKVRRFDMEEAVIDTADVNDDGYQDWRDLASGNRIYVKTELPKKRPGAEPYPVRSIVNRSHPRPR